MAAGEDHAAKRARVHWWSREVVREGHGLGPKAVGDMGVKLVFVDKVVLKGTSSMVSARAQGAAMVMGTFTKQDVKLEVTAI